MKIKPWFVFVGGLMFGVAAGLVAGWIMWGPSYSGALQCEDGTNPDKNGCCTGEVYTEMSDGYMACCPPGNGDCYPPIK